MRNPSIFVYLLILAVAPGCSSDSSGSQNDRQASKQERIESLASASTSELMDALDDASPEVRTAAYDTLEQQVGVGVTYRPYDPPEKRAAAIATYRRLKELADEQGKQHFVDLVPAVIDRMESADDETRRLAWRDIVHLTDHAHPTTADDPEADRAEAVSYYRALWANWQNPKSRVLEFRRHPEKLREHKRQWAEVLKRHEEETGRN